MLPVPDAVPVGWLIACLRDVVEEVETVDPGQSPDRQFTYVDIGAINNTSGSVVAPRRVSGADAPSRARQAIREHDVLFSTVRPYLRAIAMSPSFQNGVASTGFCVLRAAQGVDPRFLFRVVRSDAFIEHVLPFQRGSSYPAVRDADILDRQIPLPPKGEQARIADRLDELLTDLDQAVGELIAAQEKLTQYRQSLLKAAVEGALTAEWRAQNPPQETGAELLARILRERRARWEARQLERFTAQGKVPPTDWRAKYVEPAMPASATEAAAATTWACASIGQCFQVAMGATPSRKEPSYWGGTVPWVSSGEVRFERIAATRECISEAGLNNSSTRMNPVGSVLLGMIGEGKTRGQVAILGIPATNNQNCAAIWVSETDIPPEFVYYWLWSRYDETRRGSSGNNQPALNKTLVEAMPLPVPPVAEAREIVSRVDAQLAGIAAQEREIEQLLRMATAQRQNILRAAFSGQLVPQDPNDEPAGALLARIAQARLGAERSPKPRKPRTIKEPA